MSTLTIVDTDILVDAARQVAEAIDCLDRIEQQSALAIGALTQMELLVGCRNKRELRNRALLAAIPGAKTERNDHRHGY